MSGDPPAPKAPESTENVLQAYTKYLPGLLQATSAQVGPTEQAQLGASQAVSPGYAALQEQLYRAYGPLMAETASGIEGQNMQSQAANTAATLRGPGQDVIKAGLDASRLADPEYYKAREQAGGALGNLLSPTLSGGERSEVERSLNRSNQQRGVADNPTATSTVNAAQTYGNSLRDRLGSALNLASNVMPALKSGVDPFAQATGRTGTVNTAQPTASFTQPTQTGNNAFGTGNQFMQGITGLQQGANDINANRRDTFDRLHEGLTGICCFIFLEALNGKLPWYVRAARDFHYNREPILAIGYCRMAKWLVPLMQRYSYVKLLVNITMVKPLTKHGGWLFKVNKTGWIFTPLVKFWFMTWRIYGKKTKSI